MNEVTGERNSEFRKVQPFFDKDLSIFVPGSSNEDVDDIYNDIDDNNNNNDDNSNNDDNDDDNSNNNDDGDDNPGENLAPHS